MKSEQGTNKRCNKRAMDNTQLCPLSLIRRNNVVCMYDALWDHNAPQKNKSKTSQHDIWSFLLILNTFIPKRQKNNISQHLFSHWLCLISFSILLNIQSNLKYSLHTSNFSPYKKMWGWTRVFVVCTFSQSVQLWDGNDRSSPAKHKKTERPKRRKTVPCENKTDHLLCFLCWSKMCYRFSFENNLIPGQKAKINHTEEPQLIKREYICRQITDCTYPGLKSVTKQVCEEAYQSKSNPK